MSESPEQQSQPRSCPECGQVLAPGVEECPHCAQAQGGEEEKPPAGTSLHGMPVEPPQGSEFMPQRVSPLPPPLPYSMAETQPAEMPAEVIVVAVLLFIGALTGFIALVSNAHNLAHPPPMWSASPASHTVFLLAMIMGLLNLIAKTVFGVGLLRLSSWARKATIYGLIPLCLLGTAIQVYSFSLLKGLMQQAMSSASPAPPAFLSQFMISVSIIVTVVIAFAYTGLLIYLLCRPSVVRAFGD